MSRWQNGEVEIERLLASDDLQTITGAAANGEPWLDKARRTLTTAISNADADPDSAFTLAYDAARFICVALLTQQGLRTTTKGGHYAIDVAVRAQFGGAFQLFGSLRRQRNEIEYPLHITGPLSAAEVQEATGVAQQLLDAAEKLLPHLGMFR